MSRENFTVYSKDLDSGDVIKNDTTIIDNEGSSVTDYTSIFDLYDKSFEDESRVLVGQLLSNTQYILKTPINNRYSSTNHTFFFKNGSVNAETNTFNWIPGNKTIATIVYGSGEYVGATGYVEFDNKNYNYDICYEEPLFTDKVTFVFTN
jgi:hypothetical protein